MSSASDAAAARPAAGSPFDLVEAGPARAEQTHADRDAPRFVEPLNPSVAALRERFPDAVRGNAVSAGDEDVVHVDAPSALEVLRWLHDDPGQQYDHLADVTAVDYGGGRPIEVVYQLWSIPNRAALRIKCGLAPGGLEIDSVTPIWAGANWLEREVFDLFGVTFKGHPDLRRILMPDNYGEGHPLRKDFPLRGRFSRAEQTRRALTQDPDDYYIPGEIGDRQPQLAEPQSQAPGASQAARREADGD